MEEEGLRKKRRHGRSCDAMRVHRKKQSTFAGTAALTFFVGSMELKYASMSLSLNKDSTDSTPSLSCS